MIPPTVGATYRHFKGGEYIVRELSHHHDTGELWVVYRNVLSGTVYHRALSSWIERVPRPGPTRVCFPVRQGRFRLRP